MQNSNCPGSWKEGMDHWMSQGASRGGFCVNAKALMAPLPSDLVESLRSLPLVRNHRRAMLLFNMMLYTGWTNLFLAVTNFC
jgi:hypothetical protein